jgi:hypothetical protein
MPSNVISHHLLGPFVDLFLLYHLQILLHAVIHSIVWLSHHPLPWITLLCNLIGQDVNAPPNIVAFQLCYEIIFVFCRQFLMFQWSVEPHGNPVDLVFWGISCRLLMFQIVVANSFVDEVVLFNLPSYFQMSILHIPDNHLCLLSTSC